MEEENLIKLLEIVKKKTDDEDTIKEIKKCIQNKNYTLALEKIEKCLNSAGGMDEEEAEINQLDEFDLESIQNEEEQIYPQELKNYNLEKDFIGILLANPKLMSKYYILYNECYFDNKVFFEIYKSIVFTEGEAYTPYTAKEGYNFAKIDYTVNMTKQVLLDEYENNELDLEKIYTDLKKLFILRKSYISMPVKKIQDEIVKITNYKLYNKMSEEEVKNAINQVLVTNKFKQSVLNGGVTDFLIKGNNSLTNGLSLPFKILSNVFKGIRRGETCSFAMPSNAGKSRFTINLASYVAFVHKQKVLIISNEMSEEKMKLCLITTIINNKAYQDLHHIKIKKSESELLEFKFRPDNVDLCEVDDEGFVVKKKGEKQEDFIKRLKEISEEFRKTTEITDWVNKQTENAIYFVNITDHTNDELQKIIMNYYYKEEIKYIFYDTLKTDTANIGNGEEIKKTATILSNLAQNFNIYICSTLQLMETKNLPINLDINDLAVSKTVKEVLDTLCLAKQISNDTLKDYQYSEKEVDNKFYDLKKYEDPDVRYYACVVDKNRAGAKPKVLFKLNLAYNTWEELGYLKLKQ